MVLKILDLALFCYLPPHHLHFKKKSAKCSERKNKKLPKFVEIALTKQYPSHKVSQMSITDKITQMTLNGLYLLAK